MTTIQDSKYQSKIQKFKNIQSGVDVDVLMKALENQENESLMNLTTIKIKEMNLNIIKELHLPREMTLSYMKKINGYRYVDELKDIKYGTFIKWIPISDPEYLPLNSGGMLCDIKVTDTGVILICKNFMHKHYQIKLDECLLFQKLSNQELVLLSALDHLAK